MAIKLGGGGDRGDTRRMPINGFVRIRSRPRRGRYNNKTKMPLLLLPLAWICLLNIVSGVTSQVGE